MASVASLTGLRDGKRVSIQLVDLGMVGRDFVSEFVVEGQALGRNKTPAVYHRRRWRMDGMARMASDEEFLERHGITEVDSADA